MEAYYRSSPYFADLDMNNLPPPPPVIPSRPKAPPRSTEWVPLKRSIAEPPEGSIVIRNPPRRVDATCDLLAFMKENHEPSAKKESD